jgi:AraC-like DNA-binding protein
MVGGVGLDLTLFDDPENTIPFAAMGRLLRSCAERIRCPHFGLLIGQRSGPSCLGVLGELCQNMTDVSSALRTLIFHLHIHDRGATPALSVERGVAVLSYLIYQQGVEGLDQIYDGAIAVAFNILRALCGPIWLPTEVLFSRRQPEDAAPYRKFFQAPLRFDREQTALVFPAKWLDSAVAGADPLLRQQIERRIAEIEYLDNRDLVGQLRRTLRILLITHRGSLDQVAELLSMHPRTLNRRLKARGATFQALADEIRYEIARQLVEHTQMSMSQIAATLDYADASAFTRAFRRWSGDTPAAWRARTLA